MKNRLAALSYRRRILLEKIEAQRMDVAVIAQDLQRPLALADMGLKAARFIRNYPGLVAGSLAVLLSLRGKGVAGLAQKGWRLMYLYPSILSFGLNYLFSAFRSPSAEELLEERNAEVGHSQ